MVEAMVYITLHIVYAVYGIFDTEYVWTMVFSLVMKDIFFNIILITYWSTCSRRFASIILEIVRSLRLTHTLGWSVLCTITRKWGHVYK